MVVVLELCGGVGGMVMQEEILFDVCFCVFVDLVEEQQCDGEQEGKGVIDVYGQVDVLYYGFRLLYQVCLVVVVGKDCGDQCVVDIEVDFQFVQYC